VSDGTAAVINAGAIYFDADIAAVVNYVTARFGAASSNLTDKDIAQLRSETVR
jgi:mono/diheme cytochrome c family protein